MVTIQHNITMSLEAQPPSSTTLHNHYQPLNPLSSLIFPVLTLLVFALHRLLKAVLADYALFLSLGPGGTPSTPLGYLRIKCLGIFATKDPFTPVPVLAVLAPSLKRGKLASLPHRKGPRPAVVGIAPHRQQDQRPSADVFDTLRREIERISTAHARLALQTSCLEKHGPGLFVS